MFNYKYLVEFKLSHIKHKFEQVTLPANKRIKRGLINGLGSIWKSISGNLDQSDADKYDKAIVQLNSNQQKLKHIAGQQLSLTDKALHVFNDSMTKLQHNQILLESRILQVDAAMKELKINDQNNYTFIMINTIFNQLIAALDIIAQILDNIENAITFAKLNVLHPSIITSDELKMELNNINSHLKVNSLPYTLDEENLINYYSIISIKGYIHENKVVFILEIPLVESKVYNYYQLYSLPMLQQQIYKVIIPKTKYLTLSENQYGLSNDICKEVSQMNFLCEDQILHQLTNSENDPCEVNLINFSNKYANCKSINTLISKTKIQKLSNNKWIVITVNETTATRKCKNNKDNLSLHGTYVITVPNSCELSLGANTLGTSQNSNPQLKHIELPNIQLRDRLDNENSSIVVPIPLDDIQLNDLKEIELLIKDSGDQLKNIEPSVFHFNNISLYTVMLYVIIILIILYYFKDLFPCLKKKILVKSQSISDPFTEIELKN